jgi:hypothetical protein
MTTNVLAYPYSTKDFFVKSQKKAILAQNGSGNDVMLLFA